MCLIKGVFVGEKNFDVIKMHGTTIKKTDCSCVDWIYLARDRDKRRAPCKHGNETARSVNCT